MSFLTPVQDEGSGSGAARHPTPKAKATMQVFMSMLSVVIRVEVTRKKGQVSWVPGRYVLYKTGWSTGNDGEMIDLFVMNMDCVGKGARLQMRLVGLCDTLYTHLGGILVCPADNLLQERCIFLCRESNMMSMPLFEAIVLRAKVYSTHRVSWQGYPSRVLSTYGVYGGGH